MSGTDCALYHDRVLLNVPKIGILPVSYIELLISNRLQGEIQASGTGLPQEQ